MVDGLMHSLTQRLMLLQWANMSMTVRDKQYKMLRMHFMSRCKPSTDQ